MGESPRVTPLKPVQQGVFKEVVSQGTLPEYHAISQEFFVRKAAMEKRLDRLKEMLRDALPLKHQVPIKYHYNRLRGFLEPELGILDCLVRNGDVAIDVGGNRGTYTFVFWKLGCTVKVFEPNVNCLMTLKAWAGGKDRVAVYNFGLSNNEGVVDLFVPIDAAGVEHDSSASLERPENGKFRQQTIDLRTLDSFGFTDVALIKIDVEGHEQSVVEGASKTIGRWQPALLIEIEQRHGHADIAEVFKSIGSLGYDGFFLKKNRLCKIETFDVAVDQNLQNFGAGHENYINNFLFLASAKLAAGRYKQLFDKFTPS
jgi:FkbM family methyltransferase